MGDKNQSEVSTLKKTEEKWKHNIEMLRYFLS